VDVMQNVIVDVIVKRLATVAKTAAADVVIR